MMQTGYMLPAWQQRQGLGDLGAFDPLGIGIDFSDPTTLLITGAVVYFLFFYKGKGRRKGLF